MNNCRPSKWNREIRRGSRVSFYPQTVLVESKHVFHSLQATLISLGMWFGAPWPNTPRKGSRQDGSSRVSLFTEAAVSVSLPLWDGKKGIWHRSSKQWRTWVSLGCWQEEKNKSKKQKIRQGRSRPLQQRRHWRYWVVETGTGLVQRYRKSCNNIAPWGDSDSCSVSFEVELAFPPDSGLT